MIEELIKVFSSDYEDIYGVVLSGEGKVFCAGADIDWMKRMGEADYDTNLQSSLRMAYMFKLMDEFPLPVVSKVHGAVIGGGIGIVSVSDIVLALEGTIFAWSEVKLGLVPAVVSHFSIRKIGKAKARRYFLTGERFDARKAHEIGLVDEVHPTKDELEGALERILGHIRENGKLAMKLTKRLIREIDKVDDFLFYSAEVISRARASEEAQRRLDRFLRK